MRNHPSNKGDHLSVPTFRSVSKEHLELLAQELEAGNSAPSNILNQLISNADMSLRSALRQKKPPTAGQ
jgi:hypothetical protein